MISKINIPITEDSNSENNNLPKDSKSKWTDLSDVELWNQYKAGNTQAFIYIYKTYNGLLYNYGMQFFPHHELVRDCIQETFLYLQNRRKSVLVPSQYKTLR